MFMSQVLLRASKSNFAVTLASSSLLKQLQSLNLRSSLKSVDSTEPVCAPTLASFQDDFLPSVVPRQLIALLWQAIILHRAKSIWERDYMVTIGI